MPAEGRIRLVACDLDGTLLPAGRLEVSREAFGEIRRLAAKGIRFCPASGRQHTSLRKLFAPVADELYYICENGAIVYGPGSPGPALDSVAMDRELALELCHDILAVPGCEIQISGDDRSYLCPKEQRIVYIMRDLVGNNVTVLERPEDVPEPVVKVAAYNPAGAEFVKSKLDERWKKHFRTAISGDCWFDFNATDKGGGLARLCARLGIATAEVMAFGDSWNDEPLLRAAGRPYIMGTADPELLARFPRRCGRVEDVLKTL